MSTPLLEVKDLKTHFPVKKGWFGSADVVVKAVDGVSFQLYAGETLGIVGESGCGKSTTGRSILRLIEPTSGSISFLGKELTELSMKELRNMRKEMQIVFQDPYSSLNPRKKISAALREVLVLHHPDLNASEREHRVRELFTLVGLNPQDIDRYPHEFSGGQRQRIGIARALAVGPKLIIADEPVSALDVSIQAQILNLFAELQMQLGLTYIFIAHDLSVVKHISDRIGVMYLGRMVEFARKDQLFAAPLHPYTQALMSAVPIPDPTKKRERIHLTGDVPSPESPPAGCCFHTRCKVALDLCKAVPPRETEVEPGHFVACHLYG